MYTASRKKITLGCQKLEVKYRPYSSYKAKNPESSTNCGGFGITMFTSSTHRNISFSFRLEYRAKMTTFEFKFTLFF